MDMISPWNYWWLKMAIKIITDIWCCKIGVHVQLYFIIIFKVTMNYENKCNANLFNNKKCIPKKVEPVAMYRCCKISMLPPIKRCQNIIKLTCCWWRYMYNQMKIKIAENKKLWINSCHHSFQENHGILQIPPPHQIKRGW